MVPGRPAIRCAHVDRVEVVAHVDPERGLDLGVRVGEHALERGSCSSAREEGRTPRRRRFDRRGLHQTVDHAEEQLVDRRVEEQPLLPASGLVQPALGRRVGPVASGEHCLARPGDARRRRGAPRTRRCDHGGEGCGFGTRRRRRPMVHRSGGRREGSGREVALKRHRRTRRYARHPPPGIDVTISRSCAAPPEGARRHPSRSPKKLPRPPAMSASAAQRSAASTKPGIRAFQPLVLASRHDDAFRAEAFPSGVHDLQPSGAVAQVDEGQLDVGGVAAVAADVPEVPETVRRVPRRDLAPVDLGAVRGSLEDAAAQARFERDDRVGMPRRGMALWPPARQARGPHVEGMLSRAIDLEAQSERIDASRTT